MNQNYDWIWLVGGVLAAYVLIRNLRGILLGLAHLVGALLVFGAIVYVALGTALPFEQRVVAGGVALLVGVWLARIGPRRDTRSSGPRTCGVCGGSGWVKCTAPFCPLASYQGGVCGRCMGSGSTQCPGCHGLG
jgi:hypothetical protein